MSRSHQVNVRLSTDEFEAIEATGRPKSTFVHDAIAEKIERDAGSNPARLAMAPLVWQLIELAVFHELVTPAELSEEARKYADREATSSEHP